MQHPGAIGHVQRCWNPAIARHTPHSKARVEAPGRTGGDSPTAVNLLAQLEQGVVAAFISSRLSPQQVSIAITVFDGRRGRDQHAGGAQPPQTARLSAHNCVARVLLCLMFIHAVVAGRLPPEPS